MLCTLSTVGETVHARTRSLGRCPMSKNPSWQSPGRFPRFLLSFLFYYGPGRRSNIRCPNEARSVLDVRGPDRGTRKRFVPVPEIDEAVSQREDLTCRRHGCQRHAGDRRTKINKKGGGYGWWVVCVEFPAAPGIIGCLFWEAHPDRVPLLDAIEYHHSVRGGECDESCLQDCDCLLEVG